ncbi:hypothetical protein HYC85_015599 [Camellia sinensis]|uniref:CASP-like protein n=1 Tax=Camellia sinensis TaxID=4442 RepID=A0A7J7GZH1_CAMSI|nr:hypothetical protein HYC85_015599 [Camellia sinensis]
MKTEQIEAAEASRAPPPRGNKGIAIVDLVLRVVALLGTLGSTVAMGTTNETLPFFTQFVQFKAQYNDIPTFTFFVIANSIVCGYLVLSLLLSVFHIVRSGAKISRVILIFFDTVNKYFS